MDASTIAKKDAASLQESLASRIETRNARIGVIGLGYVGLPLAIEYAKTGFTVSGFEIDPARIRDLMAGRSYIGDLPSEDIQQVVQKQRFHPTTNFNRLADMDVVIICVPTPLGKSKDPDISFIASATERIAKHLHRGQLIVLESTTYPGTTRDYVLPALERTGLRVGRDFFLAFSPERIDPGNPKFNLRNTPKVVGGLTPACGTLTELLYSQIIEKVTPVSSAESAEMVKLLENTFRAVNIGLVNEIAVICNRLGLNVWEVINAAATKPYGFMPFYPGPGLGGHCIPVDPHYLSWKMRSLNSRARFIELADDINSAMPEFVVEKTARALNDRRKCMRGAKVLVLGVAYKPDVSDLRESPALDVLQLLQRDGAEVSYHDPFIPQIACHGLTLRSRPLSSGLLKRQDAVIVVTPHSAFRPADLAAQAPLIIDTRNVLKDFTGEHIIRL